MGRRLQVVALDVIIYGGHKVPDILGTSHHELFSEEYEEREAIDTNLKCMDRSKCEVQLSTVCSSKTRDTLIVEHAE